VPAEALTVEQALRAFTLDAAYASFDEDRKGSITPGKLGDLVVLGANPLEVAPTDLRDVLVEATMIGGAFVHGDPA
jgi:predicted amidohydrolase YtcJ